MKLWVLSVASCVFMATPLMAQTPPPIGGVSGTVAPEGSGDQAEAGANAIVAKTADGTRHLLRAAKDLLMHGKASAPVNDFLSELRPGSAVVLHYAVPGADAAALGPDRLEDTKVHEGMVLSINRGKQEISVRLEDKTVDTLQLAETVAREAAPDPNDSAAATPRVVVDYTDDQGRKMSHAFKKKP